MSPLLGMLAWQKAAGHWVHWRGVAGRRGELAVTAIGVGGELPAARFTVAGVQVVGPRQPAVPSPSGGTTIDHEARAAIDALTAALKTHGLID